MKKAWVMALVFVLVSSMLVTAAGPKGALKATRIEGKIAAIDSVSLQLLVDVVVDGVTVQVTVQVTPDTLIRIKDVPISFDDLRVGMTVVVCGTMDADVLKAHTITVKYGGK